MAKAPRVMFIGDLHLRFSNPEMRIDSYADEMKDLLVQSFRMAEDEGCEAVVFLGDIFHEHEVHSQIRNQTIDLLRTNPENGKPWKFSLHAIMGNHDLKYHNPEMLDQTALGTLSRVGLNIADSIPEHDIFCGHYQRKIEHVDFSHRKERIYALHAYVLPQHLASLGHGEYACIDDYPVHENCELVITGHYHDGYGIIERDDGVTFVNPGALSRAEATKSNMERSIQVAIVHLTKKLKVRLEKLDHKSADQMFDLDRIANRSEKIGAKKELAGKLMEMRREHRNISSENSIDVFRAFADEMHISPEAREKAVEQLQGVMLEKQKDR